MNDELKVFVKDLDYSYLEVRITASLSCREKRAIYSKIPLDNTGRLLMEKPLYLLRNNLL